jgi:hypothetical protein
MKGRFLLAPGIVVLALCGLGADGRGRQVTPGCRVVKVVDPKGRPIAGAKVLLLPCDVETEACTNPIESRFWLTDSTGRVCDEELLGLDHGGALEVTAPDRVGGMCAGAKHVGYPKGLPASRRTRPVVVKLDAPALPTARLEGRILSSGGRSIAGATIAVESVVVADRCSFVPQLEPSTSSSNGQFSFAAIARGSAALRITHSDFAPRTASVVVPSTAIEIVLDEGASWQGRVLDPDGKPVTDCKVSARASGTVFTSSPGSAGGFSFRHLPAGDVEVSVWTEEQSQLGARMLTMKVGIASNEHRDRDLFWPRGVKLSGIIVDQNGTPIPEARLSALPRGSDRRPSEFHPSEVVLRADANGHFVFRHLAPGPWVIEGDLRGVLAGRLGKLDIEAKTDREGLRLVVPALTEN